MTKSRSRSFKSKDWQSFIYALIGFLLGNNDIIDVGPVLDTLVLLN